MPICPRSMEGVCVSAVEPRRVVNRAAYRPSMGGIYFLVGVLFLYSGKGKLFDDNGHAPAALAKQFDGTFIGTFPGVDALWVIVGILELLIAALMVLSLLRGL